MFKKFIAPAALALSMLAGSMPASAGVFVTSVKISNALPDWLQVAELQAFSGSTNVALASNGAVATASSVYQPLQPTYNPVADYAIDGNTGGNFYTDGIYHSNSTSGSEFLEVTFGRANLSSLTIFGRTDCCSTRDIFNYELYDGTTLVGSGQLDARSASSATVALPEPATWAMMLLGFCMIGLGIRRRSPGVAAASLA